MAVYGLLLVAADATSSTSDSNLLTVIFTVGGAAVGTLFTALGPVMLELVKGRINRQQQGQSGGGGTPTPPAPGPTPASPSSSPGPRHENSPLSPEDRIIQEAVDDYRKQRDEAMNHYYAVQMELQRSLNIIAQQSVVIARLQARLNIDPQIIGDNE